MEEASGSTRTRTTATGVVYDHHAGDAAATPVVLVHAGVADRRMWEPQVEALAGQHPLVLLDQRGFGESDAPGPDGWTRAGDLLAVLDELGIQRVHLVGASMGAGTCVEAALERPELVASLLLAPPGGSLLATMTPDLRAFIDAEEAALEAGDLDAAVEANVAAWAAGPGRTEADLPAGMAGLVRDMQRRAFELGDAVGEPAEPDVDPLDRLAGVTAPVLVVLGGHDLETTADATARLVAGLPDVGRVDWPDAAHLPSMEHPGRFTALLRDWLAAHR